MDLRHVEADNSSFPPALVGSVKWRKLPTLCTALNNINSARLILPKRISYFHEFSDKDALAALPDTDNNFYGDVTLVVPQRTSGASPKDRAAQKEARISAASLLAQWP